MSHKIEIVSDKRFYFLTIICDPQKVKGCETALRSDKRPWCSLDKIFTGNFIFCNEDEAIKLKRVNELKAEELYKTAANGLMENLKPEKYDLYKVMLDQEYFQHFLCFVNIYSSNEFELIDVDNKTERQLS